MRFQYLIFGLMIHTNGISQKQIGGKYYDYLDKKFKIIFSTSQLYLWNRLEGWNYSYKYCK